VTLGDGSANVSDLVTVHIGNAPRGTYQGFITLTVTVL